MELLVILLPIFIFSYLAGRHHIFPYFDGTKQIDHLKHPILARAQRIHRYKNVKAREIEARTMWTHFNTKRLEVETAIDKAIEKSRLDSQAEHLEGSYKWDTDFINITREEDERKRREGEKLLAEIKRKEEAARAELREKELEIWTANEKARIARYKAEEAARQAEEDRRVTALLQQREKDIQSLSKHKLFEHDPNNQTMFVTVHGLYVRKLPTKDSRMIDNLSHNSWLTVNGWISHEEVYGNPIWFRLANGQGWVWSGGVNSQSTTGLENLNHMKAPGDTYELRSFDGSVSIKNTEPSELQSLIDAELSALKSEKQALEDGKTTNYYQSTAPTAPIRVGSMWFDTDNGNSAYSWDGHVWLPFGQNDFTHISSNMITADYIYPLIKKTKISTGGLTIDATGFRNNQNQLLTPKQVQEIVAPSGHNGMDSASKGYINNLVYEQNRNSTNFWRGTQFDGM